MIRLHTPGPSRLTAFLAQRTNASAFRIAAPWHSFTDSNLALEFNTGSAR